MILPEVDVCSAGKQIVEFQVIILHQLVQHFRIEIIPIQDAEFTLEVLHIHQHIVRSRLVNGKLVFIHAELFHHLHKSIDRKGIMLHGNTEFFLYFFFLYILGFN